MNEVNAKTLAKNVAGAGDAKGVADDLKKLEKYPGVVLQRRPAPRQDGPAPAFGTGSSSRDRQHSPRLRSVFTRGEPGAPNFANRSRPSFASPTPIMRVYRE